MSNETGIFVVHGGKDYQVKWEDLDLNGVPAHMVSDADLKAAVENALEFKAGTLAGDDLKRPTTGRILISGRASLG